MTYGEEGNRGRKFYCIASIESECICNRIVGYDAETGTPRVDMTKEEWAYLYNRSVSQVGDDLKLDTDIHTVDTGLAANTTTENTADDAQIVPSLLKTKL